MMRKYWTPAYADRSASAAQKVQDVSSKSAGSGKNCLCNAWFYAHGLDEQRGTKAQLRDEEERYRLALTGDAGCRLGAGKHWETDSQGGIQAGADLFHGWRRSSNSHNGAMVGGRPGSGRP